MIEKKADANPIHPSSTEPVCKLKQRNPSTFNDGIAAYQRTILSLK
jgi:hypothetical protein